MKNGLTSKNRYLAKWHEKDPFFLNCLSCCKFAANVRLFANLDDKYKLFDPHSKALEYIMQVEFTLLGNVYSEFQ